MLEGIVAVLINLIDILGIFLIIFAAVLLQFLFHEIPCPLCLLQRWGLLAIAFGFALNVKFGIRTSHYAIALLSALYTAAVSSRQILLHITPDSGSFGNPIFGLHLYTWVFIFCIGIIAFISLLFFFEDQFKKISMRKMKAFKPILPVVFALIILLTFTNSIATFIECGIYACPDNPVTYKY